MDVSIVIVNYRTSALVIECINSIIKNTQSIDYEIIVVDNATEPNLADELSDLFADRVKTIILEDNIGFGQANNVGFRYASGRNVLCLNPDTIVLNNAIAVMSEFLDRKENAGACCANLYDENMQPTHSFMRVLPGLATEINRMFLRKPLAWIYGNNFEHNFTKSELVVGYICGASMMVKKQILNQTKGFDKSFFMYYEDTDLSWRIKRLGCKLYSIPSAKIQHLEGKSYKRDKKGRNRQKSLQIEKSYYTFLRRRYGKAASLIILFKQILDKIAKLRQCE